MSKDSRRGAPPPWVDVRPDVSDPALRLHRAPDGGEVRSHGHMLATGTTPRRRGGLPAVDVHERGVEPAEDAQLDLASLERLAEDARPLRHGEGP